MIIPARWVEYLKNSNSHYSVRRLLTFQPFSWDSCLNSPGQSRGEVGPSKAETKLLTYTCSKLTIETLEKGVKYVQS